MTDALVNSFQEILKREIISLKNDLMAKIEMIEKPPRQTHESLGILEYALPTASCIGPVTSSHVDPVSLGPIFPTTHTSALPATAASALLTTPTSSFPTISACILSRTPFTCVSTIPSLTTPGTSVPTISDSGLLATPSNGIQITTPVTSLPTTPVISPTSAFNSVSSIHPAPLGPATPNSTQTNMPSTDLVSKTYWSCGGCSVQFGFNLLKSLFDNNTLKKSNISGKKGLDKLNAEVIQLIKCHIRNLFHINNEEEMKKIISSINLKLKNYRRYLK